MEKRRADHSKVQPRSFRALFPSGIVPLSLWRIGPDCQDAARLDRFDAAFALAETIDETLMRLFVNLVVQGRVGMEPRRDREDDGEQERRLLTDPRGRVSGRIEQGKVDVGKVEETAQSSDEKGEVSPAPKKS